MRTPTIIAAVIITASCSDVVGASQAARAARSYQGPWESRTIAASEVAVARLGESRARSVQSIVVSIPALIASGEVTLPGLWNTVQKLARAVDELGTVETSRAVQIDRLRRNAVRIRPH
jgi:hypothetical protein